MQKPVGPAGTPARGNCGDTLHLAATEPSLAVPVGEKARISRVPC